MVNRWIESAAFALAYGIDELQEIQDAAMFLEGPEIGDDAVLTEGDWAYLLAPEPALDMYPEMRATEEE